MAREKKEAREKFKKMMEEGNGPQNTNNNRNESGAGASGWEEHDGDPWAAINSNILPPVRNAFMINVFFFLVIW